MAPLILHNVPDDELYVGEDGKQRPYAMVFPQHEGHHAGVRGRRAVAETGSFGKSARRSRSKTATPARREDPTLAAADKVFSNWFDQQRKGKDVADAASTQKGALSQRRPSSGSPVDDAATVAAAAAAEAGAPTRFEKKTPVEVILRGFRSQAQQYAAINHYEILAGDICEDYPRDPPVENRRYKSELRDPAYTRRRRLTPEERTLVNRADGGEHWIKVTFESAAAAETAIAESPQSILGHWVYAELYHGGPPARDEAVPDMTPEPAALLAGRGARFGVEEGSGNQRLRTVHGSLSRGQPRPENGRGGVATLPKSFSASGLPGKFSPSNSHASSHTVDTGTLGSFADTMTLSSSGTVTQGPHGFGANGVDAANGAASSSAIADEDGVYCRKAPTVRRALLLPAEQALLPQQSFMQRALNIIPFLKWFSGSMIGNEVPRNDSGEFDWDKASLYWKFIWWLDATFRLFGGEILTADKDD